MKRRELKRKIFDAYKSETPDLSFAILASCEKELQEPAQEAFSKGETINRRMNFNISFKRVSVVAACLVLFVFGVLLGKFMQRDTGAAVTPNAETFVYFDVNPSIELQMDGKNNIVECLAGNADAETVLAGLKLEGVDMNTALTAIVGSMYVNGYLTEDSNSILISVETSDDEKNATILNDIAAKINSVFEKTDMECSIIAQRLKVNELLKQRAKENGISVGKMYLLDKMSDRYGGLSEDALKKLSELSIRDLNLIYLQKTNDGIKYDDELVSGAVNVAVSSDEAINAVIAKMGKTADDVECYRTFFLPSKQGEVKVVYAVVLMLYDDPSVYKYEVDCQTGEVRLMAGTAPDTAPHGELPLDGPSNPQPEDDATDQV